MGEHCSVGRRNLRISHEDSSSIAKAEMTNFPVTMNAMATKAPSGSSVILFDDPSQDALIDVFALLNQSHNVR